MSPALANDGVSSIMVLLAVLLAMMLFAVIRAPEWEGSSGQGHRLAVCALVAVAGVSGLIGWAIYRDDGPSHAGSPDADNEERSPVSR
jgi:hypothetical protein